MKNTFLPIAILAFFTSQAQPGTKAFALTDAVKGGYQWNQIQAVDLHTGTSLGTVLDGRKTTGLIKYEGGISTENSIGTSANALQIMPLGQASAALAYDEQHNRLYFSTMFQLGEVRFVDLNEAQPYVHVVKFSQKINNTTDHEADNFTRMVIGADGNGYATTNDGNTFVRFSTGKNGTVENLGALVDDEKNGGISVHNRSTSWGGDMVADAFGKLYLITVNKQIFKIDPNSRVATYIGAIQGLPVDFTCNGAAVAENGKLIVSNATKASGYYSLNLEDLQATILPGSEGSFNASDLATSNLYGQNKVDSSLNAMNNIVPMTETFSTNNKISIYPNPVINGRINIIFNELEKGDYTITLVDQASRYIAQKQLTIAVKGQTTTLRVDSKLAKGMYYLSVSANNVDKPTVFANNVIVE